MNVIDLIHSIFLIIQAHESQIRCMKWSHNEEWLLTADHSGYVKYWQANMNNVEMYQAHKEPIRGVRYACACVAISCPDRGPRLTLIIEVLDDTFLTTFLLVAMRLYTAHGMASTKYSDSLCQSRTIKLFYGIAIFGDFFGKFVLYPVVLVLFPLMIYPIPVILHHCKYVGAGRTDVNFGLHRVNGDKMMQSLVSDAREYGSTVVLKRFMVTFEATVIRNVQPELRWVCCLSRTEYVSIH